MMRRVLMSLTLVAVVGSGACDGPGSSPTSPPDEVPGPLALVTPRLEGFDPTAKTVEGGVGSLDDAPQLIDVGDVVFDIPVSIINPMTTVVFDSDGVLGSGMNHYTGNVGSITTTVKARFGGLDLGQQSVSKTQNGNMFLDFGEMKFIHVGARIYTDYTCGLSASANSSHSAWWELFGGNSVNSWGKVSVPTESGPKSQTACGQRYESRDTGSGGGDGSQYTYCTYLITYDLETGEIVRTELLYCTSGSTDDDILL